MLAFLLPLCSLHFCNRDGWFKWLLRKQLCNGGIFITELIYTLATVERRSLQLPLNFQPVWLNECIYLPSNFQKPHVFKRFSFQFRGFDRTTRTPPRSAPEFTSHAHPSFSPGFRAEVFPRMPRRKGLGNWGCRVNNRSPKAFFGQD